MLSGILHIFPVDNLRTQTDSQKTFGKKYIVTDFNVHESTFEDK